VDAVRCQEVRSGASGAGAIAEVWRRVLMAVACWAIAVRPCAAVKTERYTSGAGGATVFVGIGSLP
jgi:hypothetical protein